MKKSNKDCVNTTQPSSKILDHPAISTVHSYFDAHQDEDLNSLFTKIKAWEQLNQTILNYLDPSLKAYCQIAPLNDKKLTILTANGSIATQLRFQLAALLRTLKQVPAFAHLASIQIKVNPAFSRRMTRNEQKQKPMANLGPQTADLLAKMAASLEDQELREVMERIAGRKSS